ncbi:SspB family protein, partial [Acidocella sp.]
MSDDDDDLNQPESLLPYDEWTQEALRQVVVSALRHAAAEGLPGGHHFYITFRTDYPGVQIPDRLRAQYPEDMTIVLQHQFHSLTVDDAGKVMSVGLSFSGIPSTLVIPLAAISAFADPEVRFGLHFEVTVPEPIKVA